MAEVGLWRAGLVITLTIENDQQSPESFQLSSAVMPGRGGCPHVPLAKLRRAEGCFHSLT